MGQLPPHHRNMELFRDRSPSTISMSVLPKIVAFFTMFLSLIEKKGTVRAGVALWPSLLLGMLLKRAPHEPAPAGLPPRQSSLDRLSRTDIVCSVSRY